MIGGGVGEGRGASIDSLGGRDRVLLFISNGFLSCGFWRHKKKRNISACKSRRPFSCCSRTKINSQPEPRCAAGGNVYETPHGP